MLRKVGENNFMSNLGSSGGLVVSIVGSRSRGPGFDSCHRQTFPRAPTVLLLIGVSTLKKE